MLFHLTLYCLDISRRERPSVLTRAPADLPLTKSAAGVVSFRPLDVQACPGRRAPAPFNSGYLTIL